MRRLFVRKAFRGFGLGRQLAEAMLDVARQAGYDHVLLDTLDDMESARALYVDLGFEEIPPYYHNPSRGALPQGRYFLGRPGRTSAPIQKALHPGAMPFRNSAVRRPEGLQRDQALAWSSKVAASLTSNLPGPSTFSVTTLPSLTSME